MQLFTTFLAFLGTLVAAVPTAELQTRQSGAGGIIFKDQNLKGESTSIPGNSYCTDLDNIFGNFDGKVRSIQSAPGFQCQWYIDYGCPANGVKLDFGSKDAYIIVGDLDLTFDKKIHSIFCGPKK
ncbi:hypothetical protein G6011_00783 [Alternaria panax]|uniref:Uncharacterized protein n=1 Tax=Alternaria panax TaxID=48097 RepID=A0AAD4IJE2_9PLEO|nr:hypothetical protein G6011_00783 [Alternaria panax]